MRVRPSSTVSIRTCSAQYRLNQEMTRLRNNANVSSCATIVISGSISSCWPWFRLCLLGARKRPRAVLGVSPMVAFDILRSDVLRPSKATTLITNNYDFISASPTAMTSINSTSSLGHAIQVGIPLSRLPCPMLASSTASKSCWLRDVHRVGIPGPCQSMSSESLISTGSLTSPTGSLTSPMESLKIGNYRRVSARAKQQSL
ncbi:hypothetical protein ACFE04_016817 [Oxalis oulophora]